MKLVWIIILLLVAAGLVVWLQPPRAARVESAALGSDEAAIERAVTEPVKALPKPEAQKPIETPAPPAAPPTPTPIATDTAKSLANDLLTDRATNIGAPPAPSAPESNPAPKPAPAASDFLDGLDHPIKNATVKPGRFERKDDGSLVADGHYVIRGKGTPESPYVIPWDLLTSAMDTFSPRQGQSEIPQRIAMLDGKSVRIEGYFAFPLVSTDTKQCLVTLNQWDGCCIGVPPTAYDAIEVTLRATMSLRRSQHQIMFGTVEGVFRVEPYVMDQWLVGLYLLDDASLTMDL